MKKNVTGFLFAILTMVLSYACKYETTQIYIQPVKENVTPEIQMVALDLDKETIYIYDDKSIKFKFKSPNHQIKSVRFFIDQTEKSMVEADSGYFYIDHRNLSEGMHTATVQIVTNSATGSLADIVGAETYSLTNSWKIIVIKNFYAQLTSTFENGFLKIAWTGYLGSDLQEFIVYRNDYDKAMSHTISTTFIDSTYIGEGTRYEVMAVRRDGTGIRWGYLDVAAQFPKVHFVASADNKYVFSWDKCKYYNALQKYEVRQSDANGMNYKVVKSTQYVNDTSYVVTNALFGDDIALILKVVPRANSFKANLIYTYKYDLYQAMTLGFSLKRFENESYFIPHAVSKDEFIYTAGYDSLYKYSLSQKRILDRVQSAATSCSSEFTSYQVSPAGKYISPHNFCTGTVRFMNTADFQHSINRDVRVLSGQYYFPQIPVSDVGTAIILNDTHGFYVYDFINDTQLGYYNTGYFYPNDVMASSNGDYIFAKNYNLKLLHFSNGQFTEIWSTLQTTAPQYYQFDALNPNRLVLYDGTTITIKSCADFSTIAQYPLNDPNLVNIDFLNQEILSYNAGYLKVRKLEDGTFVSQVPVNMNAQQCMQSCILTNHAIISTKGVIYFIQ